MTSAKSDALGIALDRRADVPVGVQLRWALQALIRTGGLAPGVRLPALHRLAQALAVNPNTVRAAYAQLEQDGLVEVRHGSGTFVRPAEAGRARLAEALARAAQAAEDAGVSPRDVAAALYVDAERAGTSDPSLRRRRELRAQIAVLERTLADVPTRHRAVASATERPRGPAAPRLLSVEELEAERDHVLQELITARAR